MLGLGHIPAIFISGFAERVALASGVAMGDQAAFAASSGLVRNMLRAALTPSAWIGRGIRAAAYLSLAWMIIRKVREWVKRSQRLADLRLWLLVKMRLAKIPPPRIVDGYVPETVFKGSPIVAMRAPPAQLTVIDKHGMDRVAIGSAFRVNISPELSFLIMPDHVMSASTGELLVYSKPSLSMSLGTPDNRRKCDNFCADYVAFRVTESECSNYALPTVNLQLVLPEGIRSAVSIVGPGGKGSTGTLTHDEGVLGTVCYTGSTEPGWSGAGYSVGSMVAGFHSAGGKVDNRGLAASFVYALLKSYAKRHYNLDPESYPWLERLARAHRGGTRVRSQDWGLDEVLLQVNGQYHIIQREDYNRYFEDEPSWENVRVRHEDYHEETGRVLIEQQMSGEASTPNSPPVSVLNTQYKGEGVGPTIAQLTTAYGKLSARQKKQLRKQLNLTPILQASL